MDDGKVTVVCRDLPNPRGSNSTEYHVCECDPGYAGVVVGGTYKTCRNICSFGNEGVEDCKDVNECVLWGGNAACFFGACHNDVGRLFVRLPKRIRERRRMASRIVESRCAVWQERHWQKLPHGRAVRCFQRRSHVPSSEVRIADSGQH